MAKVIRAFKERFHNMKLYKIGDEYPEKDIERVKYLTKLGYLAEVDLEDRELVAVEEFLNLTADEQKQYLADLDVEGDDSNEDKRKALYAQYLAEKDVNADGDSDA